jgi:hypothetical protein
VAELPFFFPARPHHATVPRARSRLKIFALVCAINLGILAAAALGWSGLTLPQVLIGATSIGGMIGLGWEKVTTEIDALPGDDDHPNVR